MESDRKSASYVSAIKGAAHIIKKQEFISDGRRKAPRHPLPCPVYKLDFQFNCFWFRGRRQEAMVPEFQQKEVLVKGKAEK